MFNLSKWCPEPDLNWRPLHYQWSALPLSHLGRILFYGAGEGNRTLIISLEGFCITTMLLPHLLPRLSMVGRAGFEPAKVEPPDLQSGPVGRLGNLPMCRVTDCNKHYPMLSSIFLSFFHTSDNI